MNELKNVAEMSVEAAEEFAVEAAKEGKDIKKVVVGGIVVAVVVGGTVIMIKKVRPIERLKNFKAKRKEIREAKKAEKFEAQNVEEE